MKTVSVLRQSGLSLALKWSMVPIEFFIGVLVVRAVGPEGKGLLVLLSGLAGAISSISNIGTTYAILYLYKKNEFPFGQLIISSIILVLVPITLCILIFFFLSESFINIFIGSGVNIDSFDMTWIWIPIVNIYFLRFLALGDVLLIKDNKMKLLIIKSIIIVFTRIILTFIFVLILSWGVIGVLFSQLISSILGFSVVTFLISKSIFYNSLKFSLNATKKMFLIGFQQYGNALIGVIGKRFEIFMIAGMLSVKDAGFFGIAASIHYILSSIPEATMFPLASKLSGEDGDKLAQFTRVTRIQFSLMLILIFFLAPLVPFLIGQFYGDNFLPSITPIFFMLPGLAAMPLLISTNAYFVSRGEPGRSFFPLLISTMVQVLLSYRLIPLLGVSGGAIGVSSNSLCLASIQIFLLVKDGEIKLSELILISRKDFNLLYNSLIKILKRK